MQVQSISVIVPTYNEGDINSQINKLLKQKPTPLEIIIANHGKPKPIKNKDKRIKVLQSPKGRAKQMNFGAKQARGEILLFLHADTSLPKKGLEEVKNTIIKQDLQAGAFSLKIDSKKWPLKFFSWTTSMRSRKNKIPYGDQAIFIRKDYFKEIGGYKELLLLEDVELMQRIKKKKGRVKILKSKVKSSPRRYLKQGIWKTMFKNRLIMLLFTAGVSPRRLAKLYYKK